MRESFKTWVPITVRWADMDSMGHVNSAVYHTYFEMARMEYFGKTGLHKLKVPGKRGPAVVSQTCNYRRQLFHPAEIEVGIRCSEVGTKTFVVEYEIYHRGENELVADGTTIMAWVDYENAKAIPVPDVLRENIEALEGRTGAETGSTRADN